ncbi:hypothetical protein C8R44DRAFT_988911 [Mycena epipterygia]|nr:hypothetical protein C8R44DRAFT_988911 [Mycena epipterygia]
MPKKTKKQSRTKNLGVLAVKRSHSTVDGDDEKESKHPQIASPEAEAMNEGSDSGSDSERSDAKSDCEMIGPSFDHDSDSDEADEPGIEVHEEDDIPHPKDSAELANWLQLSDACLTALHTTTAPIHRDTYHTRKIGKDVSVRRVQELRKIEKDRQDRENRDDMRHGRKTTQINDFFSRRPAPPAP